MPLWRIPLNGITVGTPVQLFKEFTSAKDAWDSASHIQSGRLMVMSSAKAVVEKRVDFKTPFSDVPVVVVNANSATPNDVDVNAGSVDANGFSVFLYRGTNTNTHVAWLAVL